MASTAAKVQCWPATKLFGREQGALIGAISARSGRFEMDGEGTLFVECGAHVFFDKCIAFDNWEKMMTDLLNGSGQMGKRRP